MEQVCLSIKFPIKYIEYKVKAVKSCQWAIPEKRAKQGVLRTYFSECPPSPPPPHGIFYFSFYPWKFQTKPGSSHRNSTKLCYIPQKFQGQIPRLLEIHHYFFLLICGNSTLFLINPCKFHMLFFQYPLEIPYLNPPHPLLVFFWNSPIQNQTIS